MPNIDILKKSDINIYMVTGDNPLTSKEIGIKCGILSHSNNSLVDYKDPHYILDGVKQEDLNQILNSDKQLVVTGNFFTKQVQFDSQS